MHKLSQFRYEKSFNTLYGNSNLFGGRFPSKVEIVSEMTGRIVTFLPVQYGHRFYDEDHWDGRVYKNQFGTWVDANLTESDISS